MGSMVRAGALQGFDHLVRRWGADPDDLRRRHGLDGPEALGNPEAMIPLGHVARLMETAAVECRRPDLGLRLGSVQNPRMLGLLAVVVQGAHSVGGALADVSRYVFVQSPSYRVVVESTTDTRWATVRFDIAVEDDVPFRQLIDGCMSSMLTLARTLTGLTITPLSVSLPHTPIAAANVYRSVFGAPVAFGQPRAALHLERSLLSTELRTARPEIRRRAIEYIAQRYPASTPTTASRVRNSIGGTLGATRGTKAEIAGLLGLHPRTLQRRLSAEGTSFESIREDVHRSATHRLTQTALPLGQVAHALGFSEQSAMNRSVRRWFDMTPTELRSGRRPS